MDKTYDRSRLINRLYREALEDFVGLPHDIVVDLWRFHVFEGKINSSTWNDDWWKLW